MSHGSLPLDENQFPRKRFVSQTVGTTPQEIGAGVIRVHSYIFTAGAAGGTLILRSADGLTEYARVKVLVGDSKIIHSGFLAELGLQVLTTTGSDFNLTLWYL